MARSIGVQGAVALLVATLAAGCGGEVEVGKKARQVDPDHIGEQIGVQVAERLGADVKAVECPGSVDAKRGTTYDCEVVGADGSRAKVQVTMTDDEGHFAWKNGRLLHTAKVESALAEQFAGKLERRLTVTCPDVVEAPPGTKLTCRIRDDSGSEAGLAVTVINADKGKLEAEIQ
jgi:Domain of unknown function (DUF4333)